jgi:hypothetical protein
MARVRPEPVHRTSGDTGSGVVPALASAIEEALACAGEGLVALLLSGSHATREAVWANVDGREVSLSDLDLYAVMRDEDACKTARTRARTARGGRTIRCEALAGPLEIAFVTREGLAAMPARPGTVDLARQGRVLLGDAGVLDALPRWTPAAIPAEERLLLLENRAFELLWALSGASEGLPALRARHAVLKTALDLALVRSLAQGDAPPGAAARVAAARALGAPAGVPEWLVGAWDALSPVWDEALAWRMPGARVTRTEPLMPTWRTVVRAWCAVWWREACVGMRPEAPFARAAYAARRGSFARRVRRSLAFRAADGASPSLGRACCASRTARRRCASMAARRRCCSRRRARRRRCR